MVQTRVLPGFEEVNVYPIGKLIAHFNIPVYGSLAVCPFHSDSTPSMSIHDTWVYCFGCGQAWTVSDFIRDQLAIEKGRTPTWTEVFDWFSVHKEELDTIAYVDFDSGEPSEYAGPVDQDLITYWHKTLDLDKRFYLYHKRMLTDETIDFHKLGYRLDWDAYSIPFWRGVPGESLADIVQFRMMRPDSFVKYVGLPHHNRPALINADLLNDHQPYVVILLGTFDAILARQDGLIAVSPNGSKAFLRGSNGTRLKQLFKNQTNIYVVPDVTPSERPDAEALCELLGTPRTHLCTFDEVAEQSEYPIKDYTDFRLAGYSPLDFRKYVLDLSVGLPHDRNFLRDMLALIAAGDPYDLAEVHVKARAYGLSHNYRRLAHRLTHLPTPSAFSADEWAHFKGRVSTVATQQDFIELLSSMSKTMGSW